MIHKIVNMYAWHDLTEDSNDLPTDEKMCLVSIANKNTNEVYSVGYMFFDHEKKVWVENDEYDGVCYYYMSHGLQPDAKAQCLFETDIEKRYEVLAWAKKTTIDPYIPQGYAVQRWSRMWGDICKDCSKELEKWLEGGNDHD